VETNLPPRFGILTSNMLEKANSMVEEGCNGSWLDTTDYILSNIRISKLKQITKERDGVIPKVRDLIYSRW
jgi:hypothetical protein